MSRQVSAAMGGIEKKLRQVEANVRLLVGINGRLSRERSILVEALVFCRSVLGRDAIDLSEKLAIKKATKALALAGIPRVYTQGERDRATAKRRAR